MKLIETGEVGYIEMDVLHLALPPIYKFLSEDGSEVFVRSDEFDFIIEKTVNKSEVEK